MKVLLSSSTLNRKNGYGNITYELVSMLVKRGHNVTLLLPSDDPFYEYDILGATIERVLPTYIYRVRSKFLYKYITWKYPQAKNYDLVHSLFEFPYAPILCREARRYKVPFLVGAQGTYGVQPLTQWPEKYLMKYVYRNANAIIVPSEYTKTAILKESNEDYDISVVHNGVNFERFDTHEISNKALLHQYANKRILLTVGELKSRKGQDIIIKSLPLIVQRIPNLVYLVVGYDSWRNHLEKLAVDLGVIDHVVFTGPVSDNDILDYFHLCDLYVHTPRIAGDFQFEGFGIVYLEAAACGKPSVGTDAGGIKDALLHEQTGLVAENENIDQVSDYITRLLLDKNLLNKYGVAAKEYAREHAWDKIVYKFEAIYNKSTL